MIFFLIEINQLIKLPPNQTSKLGTPCACSVFEHPFSFQKLYLWFEHKSEQTTKPFLDDVGNCHARVSGALSKLHCLWKLWEILELKANKHETKMRTVVSKICIVKYLHRSANYEDKHRNQELYEWSLYTPHTCHTLPSFWQLKI